MFEAVEELIGEYADLEKKLADPAVFADQANARKLNKRYAELTPSSAPTAAGSRPVTTSAPRANWPRTTPISPPR